MHAFVWRKNTFVENAKQNLSPQSVVAIVFSETFSALYPRRYRLRQRAPKFSMCGNEVYADGFAILHTRVGIICIIARSRTLQLHFLLRYTTSLAGVANGENFSSIIRANHVDYSRNNDTSNIFAILLMIDSCFAVPVIMKVA